MIKTFLVLLLSFFMFASGVISQTINIKLSSDKTIVEAGFPVQIKFESNTQGQLTMKLPMSFVKGSTSKNTLQSINPNTGKSNVNLSFVQGGIFTEPGKYKVFATYIVNGKKYKSNKITIKVVKKTSSKNTELHLKTTDA